MSLVSFHRALILTAIVFCLVFAGWEWRVYRTSGEADAVLLSAIFALLGIALAVYLARLAYFLKLDV